MGKDIENWDIGGGMNSEHAKKNNHKSEDDVT